MRPAYCSCEKPDIFFSILHLARQSGWPEESLSDKNKKAVINLLHHLKENEKNYRRFIPLIYGNSIKTAIYDDLPSSIQSWLAQTTKNLIAADLLNYQWLITALNRLREGSIPVILLKGTAFSGHLYTGESPRLGNDIDLLVKKDDFNQACVLLGKSLKPVLLDESRLATYHSFFERTFQPQNSGIPSFDIHWGLTSPQLFNIREETLWANSLRHPAFEDETIRTMSPEDTLLHLAVHAFRDFDFCTHNMLDAHEIYCQWRPDQGLLLKRADEWGAKTALYLLLENTRSTFSSPIPDQLLELLRPAGARLPLLNSVLRAKKSERVKQKVMSYRIQQLIAQLTLPDSPIRGIRFQASYAKTRIHDWILARKHQAST